ncbi:nucleotidyltransferase and HEPN domain-containing protein [Pelagibius marinus]|uniref:nucleotidyltransferase and HEPN domain-containing protein n=1 Tax=Pelagibius marinus TaxID=2762760 RepID=UPI00187280EC|nr:nucleotidyltransferase and HEPN domain-containing protein [Pelagibius marinus]
MKFSLDHLPPKKQRELERVLEILHEEFEDALKGSSADWKKRGRILKVILFGSYARGSWVDEPHTTKGYRSDFDLLIIVNNKKLAEFEPYWNKASDRFMHDRGIKTPVSFIVHSRREVNEAIRRGQYFFTDIRKEGIVLYELDDEPLAEPRPRSPKEAYEAAKEHCEERFLLAEEFLVGVETYLERGSNKLAAFMMHQAVENAYSCLLLTLTNYTPPAHNIKFLRSLAEDQDRSLVEAWPREQATHRAWFNTLVEAYVKARYSKHYQIDREALLWLGECTQRLHKLVKVACEKHLAKLAGNAGKD